MVLSCYAPPRLLMLPFGHHLNNAWSLMPNLFLCICLIYPYANEVWWYIISPNPSPCSHSCKSGANIVLGWQCHVFKRPLADKWKLKARMNRDEGTLKSVFGHTCVRHTFDWSFSRDTVSVIVWSPILVSRLS